MEKVVAGKEGKVPLRLRVSHPVAEWVPKLLQESKINAKSV